MRHLLTLLGCASVLVTGALQACAGSDVDPATPAEPASEPDEAGKLPAFDADLPERREPDAFPEPERCSAAGWCEVSPPEDGSYTLRFSGIWPLADRAFVYGPSVAPDNGGNLPMTVLEWDHASKTFTRIDDGRHVQNRFHIYSVYAPNEDEVYYVASRAGVFGAEVYHGRRPVPPAKEWSWTTHQLGCSASLPVRTLGGGGPDVFITGCKKIYRHSADGGDGGAETWLEDVVETDATAEFGEIVGTAADNVWFYGAKAGCPYILRRTAAGYEGVVEGTYDTVERKCQPIDGLLTLDGYPTSSTAAPVGVAASGELLVLRSDGKQLARIGPADAGGYTIAYASPLPTVPEGITLQRVWGGEDGTLWFITNENSILRVTDAWTDGGASIQYSTLARNGAPNDKPLKFLRGTSSSNLWAVGNDRAFYKSTP